MTAAQPLCPPTRPVGELAIYELMFDTEPMQRGPVKHVPEWSEVLNMHWPPNPAEFRNRDNTIPVRVRIVWDGDGEEYVEGVADRWDADHVHVEVRDKRLRGNGVWVKPSDVYRRSPEPPPSTARRATRRRP